MRVRVMGSSLTCCWSAGSLRNRHTKCGLCWPCVPSDKVGTPPVPQEEELTTSRAWSLSSWGWGTGSGGDKTVDTLSRKAFSPRSMDIWLNGHHKSQDINPSGEGDWGLVLPSERLSIGSLSLLHPVMYLHNTVWSLVWPASSKPGRYFEGDIGWCCKEDTASFWGWAQRDPDE